MVEFEIEAGIHIPESKIQSERQRVEERFADVPLSFDADDISGPMPGDLSSDLGRESPATAGSRSGQAPIPVDAPESIPLGDLPDDFAGVGDQSQELSGRRRRRARREFRWARQRTTFAEEQLAILEDIEDEIGEGGGGGGLFGGLLGGAGGALGNLGLGAGAGLAGLGIGAGVGLATGDLPAGIGEGIGNAVGLTAEGIGEGLGSTLGGAGDFASGVGTGLGSTLSGTGNFASGVGEGIGSTLGGTGDFAEGVGSGLGDTFEGLGEGGADLIESVNPFSDSDTNVNTLQTERAQINTATFNAETVELDVRQTNIASVSAQAGGQGQRARDSPFPPFRPTVEDRGDSVTQDIDAPLSAEATGQLDFAFDVGSQRDTPPPRPIEDVEPLPVERPGPLPVSDPSPLTVEEPGPIPVDAPDSIPLEPVPVPVEPVEAVSEDGDDDIAIDVTQTAGDEVTRQQREPGSPFPPFQPVDDGLQTSVGDERFIDVPQDDGSGSFLPGPLGDFAEDTADTAESISERGADVATDFLDTLLPSRPTEEDLPPGIRGLPGSSSDTNPFVRPSDDTQQPRQPRGPPGQRTDRPVDQDVNIDIEQTADATGEFEITVEASFEELQREVSGLERQINDELNSLERDLRDEIENVKRSIRQGGR